MSIPNKGFIDPHEVLFSLPTLCDPAPATDGSPPSAGHRPLHEDDWRQIEFVAAANHEHVLRELAALVQFKQQHWEKVGWKNIYLRKEHPVPFAALGLMMDAPRELTQSALTLGGRCVPGGFALSESSGWSFYGQRTPRGHVVHFAISPSGTPATAVFAGLASGFANGAGVILVDWYRCLIVDTGSAESVLKWTKMYA